MKRKESKREERRGPRGDRERERRGDGEMGRCYIYSYIYTKYMQRSGDVVD